jgi:hypothetical protein
MSVSECDSAKLRISRNTSAQRQTRRPHCLLMVYLCTWPYRVPARCVIHNIPSFLELGHLVTWRALFTSP